MRCNNQKLCDKNEQEIRKTGSESGLQEYKHLEITRLNSRHF
jgi:hypothetical protein